LFIARFLPFLLREVHAAQCEGRTVATHRAIERFTAHTREETENIFARTHGHPTGGRVR
jgi:hypothetical protein